MTDLWHGTTVLRRDAILQEGLDGPVFLAEDRDLALRYAKARCAAAVERRLDARALLVRVSVDDARPDPSFGCEKGQWIADDGVTADAIMSTETVDLGWAWWKPSTDRMYSLLTWASLARVRADGYSSSAPAANNASAETRAIADLRAGLLDP